jgi:hypothetical protein
MLGNDVVDLAERDGPERHPRYDARAFGAAERRLLAREAAPERLRQLLWAAKESAFKALRRLDPATIFSPRRFAVELDATLRGRVRTPFGEVFIRGRVDGDCVHVVATDRENPGAALLQGVARSSDPDSSRAVRTLAIAELSARLSRAPGELWIERLNRTPVLRLRGRSSPAVLSLSHHGRFVAWACLAGCSEGALP